MSLFRFGNFAVCTDRFALTRDGAELDLPAIPLEILILLLRRGGALLTRKEIADAIWPEVDPADVTNRINTAINRIRSTLDDDPAKPVYIQTVIGRGYRFIAPLAMETEQTAPLLDPPEQAPAALEAPVVPAGPALRHGAAWSALAVLVLAALALSVWSRNRRLDAPAAGLNSFTQVTYNQSENHVTAAAISPDGQLIAYADADGVRLKAPGQVDSRAVPTPPARAIERLEWVGDQRHLVMSGVSRGSDTPAAWLLDTAGEPPQLLQADARHATPAPAGSRLAYTDAAENCIYIKDQPTGVPRPLIRGGAAERFLFLVWSSDGKTLLASRNRPAGDQGSAALGLDKSQNFDYLAVDTSSGKITAEVDGFRMDEAIVTPRGDLVFSREQPGGLGIWSVPIEAGTGIIRSKPVMMQFTSKDVRSLSLSNSGKLVGVIRTQSPGIVIGNVSRPPAAVLDAHPLTFSMREVYPHSWTAGSSALFFEERQPDGNFRIFRQTVGMHDATALASAPADQAFPLITPDSNWILFIGRSRKEEPYRLYRVASNGGTPALIDTGGPVGEFRCPLHGAACVLRRLEDSGHVVFYALDPVRGLGETLATFTQEDDRMGGWDLSPDGKTLVFAGTDVQHPALQLYSLASGQTETVGVATHSPIRNVHWDVDQQGWYLTTWTATGSDIFYLSRRGMLTLLRQTTGRSWADPSPDGRMLAFIDQRIDSNVWVLGGK